MKRFTVPLFALLPLLLSASDLGLPASVNGLEKSGEARYKYLFFKVFDAALYTPAETGSNGVLDAIVPKTLLIRYHRDVPASKFIDLANKTLRNQLGEDGLNAIESDLNRLNRSYLDVEAGDRYWLSYSPEKGLTVRLNDQPLAQFECQQFAANYFGVWLGEPPLSEQLKNRLLGTE